MEGHSQIFALKLSGDISDAEFAALFYQVTPARQARVKKFSKKADALRSLTAELLLRRVAFPVAGLQVDQPVFSYNEYGKPRLADKPDVHFNLSHAGHMVVCIVDSSPVGIDVEEIQPVEAAVAKTCCTPDEFKRFTAGQKADRLRYFYDLWTIKESYVKAIGKGLAFPLTSFTVRKNQTGEITVSPGGGWSFHQYDIEAGYVLSACAAHDNFPAAVRWADISDLL